MMKPKDGLFKEYEGKSVGKKNMSFLQSDEKKRSGKGYLQKSQA